MEKAEPVKQQLMESGQEVAEHLKESATEAVGQVKQTATEGAGQVADSAKEASQARWPSFTRARYWLDRRAQPRRLTPSIISKPTNRW